MLKKSGLFAAIGIAILIGQGFVSSSVQQGLTPQEKEQAHKMWLMKQAPGMDPNVAKGEIGPKLHALSTPKTVTCPTAQDLMTGLSPDGTFEKNGVHFDSSAKEKGNNVRFKNILIEFSANNNEIKRISCEYFIKDGRSFSLAINFQKSGFMPSQLSTPQKYQLLTAFPTEDGGIIHSTRDNVEFTINKPKP